MRKVFSRARLGVAALILVSMIVPAGLDSSAHAAGGGAPCTIGHTGDSCAVSALTEDSTSATMTFTMQNIYAGCAGGQTSNCLYQYFISAGTSGYGPAPTTSGVCGSKTFAAVSYVQSTGPLTCTITWTWSDSSYPAGFAVSAAELDGEAITDSNSSHSFSASRSIPSPHAEFVTAPGDADGAFTFISQGTSRVGGLHEVWSIDGDAIAQGSSFAHTFPEAGTYPVTLQVSDSGPGSDSVTHEVTFDGPPASGNSTTIAVEQLLSPQDDPGRFDLGVDGKTVIKKSGDADLAVVNVKPGQHEVSEVAQTTDLSHYDVSLACTRNGKSLFGDSTTEGRFDVKKGDHDVCRWINTRTKANHCDVPDLAGKTTKKAIKALTAANCIYARSISSKHNSSKHNRVTHSRPSAYSVNPNHTRITLYLGKKK